jgi:excisionase family DNA binding protein
MMNNNKGITLMGDSSLFDNTNTRERYLSSKEAAEFLGITPNALRIKVHRGIIKAYKLGDRLKFRVKDLRASLQPKEV